VEASHEGARHEEAGLEEAQLVEAGHEAARHEAAGPPGARSDVEPREARPRTRADRRGLRPLRLAVALLATLVGLGAAIALRRRALIERPSMGLVTVEVVPADAELLLDGAQLKDTVERGAITAHLTPGILHVFAAHREGFVDAQVSVQLARGEERPLRIELQRPPGQLLVRSSPEGARVVFDGQDRGATPALLTGVDPERAHSVLLDKRCFRPWQVTFPRRGAPPELSATLAPDGSCPR
jgi:hypothetical protein